MIRYSYVDVFDRLLRRYRATSPNRGGAYIPIPEKTMIWVYSTDTQHGNLAPPLS
ncbi:MAG: hypothetical protein J6C86_04505 [Bacteroidaceae bacterium]|nr:hypothetical protein [Bacteroidaceae bacterium]